MIFHTKNEIKHMSKTQFLNFLAIELLEKIGNVCPQQSEIDFTESLLESYSKKANNLYQTLNRESGEEMSRRSERLLGTNIRI